MNRESRTSSVLMRALAGLVGMIGLLAMIAWLAGAFTDKIPPGRVATEAARLNGEDTDTVHEVVRDDIEESVGTLKAAGRTEISARILARIEKVLVTAGAIVNADDIVIELDREELESRLKQAEQAAMSADAALSQARIDLDRERQLRERNAGVQSALDAAQSRYDIATAQAAGAKEAIESARIVLSYATIRAPRAGRVVDRLAEPGDTAQPGRPLLVVYDAESLRLEAPVMESLAIRLKPGQELVARIDALDREVTATIDEIVPQADAPSRTFLVKAIIPRTEDLYEGMFGRLLIPAGERQHLCLNEAAVQEVGQLQFVNVVRDDQTLERRLIRTGQVGIPGRVEVLSGLSAGERVVLRNARVDSE
ncbi:MAG: efflux RND transporter periplasmic adaptor subunit [Planctomycetaceae bacterium]